MKTKLLTTTLLGTALLAAPTLPNIYMNGIAIDHSSPGLGSNIFAVPGSVRWVFYNQEPGGFNQPFGNNLDFNDAIVRLEFGQNVVHVKFWYSLKDKLAPIRVAVAGPLGLGRVITHGQSMSLAYPTDGRLLTLVFDDLENVFHTGPAPINWDLEIHALVSPTLY